MTKSRTKFVPSFAVSLDADIPSPISATPFINVAVPATTVAVATATINGAAAPHVSIVAAAVIAVIPIETRLTPEKRFLKEKLPVLSTLFIGSFRQYAYALCPITPWPVERRTSEEINLPTSGL